MAITDSDLYRTFRTFIALVVMTVIAVILQIAIEPENPWIFIIWGILVVLEVCCSIDDIDISLDAKTLYLAKAIDGNHASLTESMEGLESKIEDLQSRIGDLEKKIDERNTTYTTGDYDI